MEQEKVQKRKTESTFDKKLKSISRKSLIVKDSREHDVLERHSESNIAKKKKWGKKHKEMFFHFYKFAASSLQPFYAKDIFEMEPEKLLERAERDFEKVKEMSEDAEAYLILKIHSETDGQSAILYTVKKDRYVTANMFSALPDNSYLTDPELNMYVEFFNDRDRALWEFSQIPKDKYRKNQYPFRMSSDVIQMMYTKEFNLCKSSEDVKKLGIPVIPKNYNKYCDPNFFSKLNPITEDRDSTQVVCEIPSEDEFSDQE